MRKLLSADKLEEFEEKVRKLAEKTFGRDDSGDLLVDVGIVDRTRFEPAHFFLIPYWHLARTDEERERILDLCATNVEIAAEKLSRTFRMRSNDRTRPENDFQPTMKARVEALEQERDEVMEERMAALRNNAPLRGALRDALDLAVLSSSDYIHPECLSGEKDCRGKQCKEFRTKWKSLRDVYGKNMPVRSLDKLMGRDDVKVP